MITSRHHQTSLLMLDDAARAARSGFACLFSSSDEYEAALIAERRAQGRYAPPTNPWPVILFIGGSLMVAGAVLLAL